MCGRFCVDDETAKDIERIVRKIDRELWKSGDVHPSDHAFVLRQSPKGILAEQQKWGYSSSFGNTLVFNSRWKAYRKSQCSVSTSKHAGVLSRQKSFTNGKNCRPKAKENMSFLRIPVPCIWPGSIGKRKTRIIFRS